MGNGSKVIVTSGSSGGAVCYRMSFLLGLKQNLGSRRDISRHCCKINFVVKIIGAQYVWLFCLPLSTGETIFLRNKNKNN